MGTGVDSDQNLEARVIASAKEGPRQLTVRRTEWVWLDGVAV